MLVHLTTLGSIPAILEEEGFLMSESMLPQKAAAELQQMLLNRPKEPETSIQSSCTVI